MRALAVVTLLVLSLGGSWVATQHVAAALQYAPELGPPWASLGQQRVYAPWAWVVWSRRYEARAPTPFRNASAITTLAALAGAAVAIAAALRRKRSAASRAHGSSRWATTAELRNGGPSSRCRCRALPDGRRRVSHARGPRRRDHDDCGAARDPRAPRRPRTRPLLRADPQRQRRGPGHPDAADLAALSPRLRRQKGELGAHRRMAKAI